jgi:hypothetical protein
MQNRDSPLASADRQAGPHTASSVHDQSGSGHWVRTMRYGVSRKAPNSRLPGAGSSMAPKLSPGSKPSGGEVRREIPDVLLCFPVIDPLGLAIGERGVKRVVDVRQGDERIPGQVLPFRRRPFGGNPAGAALPDRVKHSRAGTATLIDCCPIAPDRLIRPLQELGSDLLESLESPDTPRHEFLLRHVSATWSSIASGRSLVDFCSLSRRDLMPKVALATRREGIWDVNRPDRAATRWPLQMPPDLPGGHCGRHLGGRRAGTGR